MRTRTLESMIDTNIAKYTSDKKRLEADIASATTLRNRALAKNDRQAFGRFTTDIINLKKEVAVVTARLQRETNVKTATSRVDDMEKDAESANIAKALLKRKGATEDNMERKAEAVSDVMDQVGDVLKFTGDVENGIVDQTNLSKEDIEAQVEEEWAAAQIRREERLAAGVMAAPTARAHMVSVHDVSDENTVLTLRPGDTGPNEVDADVPFSENVNDALGNTIDNNTVNAALTQLVLTG